jgi:hypothetical protein
MMRPSRHGKEEEKLGERGEMNDIVAGGEEAEKRPKVGGSPDSPQRWRQEQSCLQLHLSPTHDYFFFFFPSHQHCDASTKLTSLCRPIIGPLNAPYPAEQFNA